MDEQMYKDAEKALDDLIESCGIPKGHPLNNGEKSHHSIGFLALMILNIYLGEQEVIIDYIKKCKAMEGNVFNFEKFNQAIMEPIILYYLVVNLIRSGIPIYKILYEPEVYRNGKKLEYSVLAGSTDGKINRINVEIKTLECDPLSKKNGIHYIKDGTKVVKALTSDEEKVTWIKEQYPDYICLEYKDYYRQFNKNEKKIIEKYTGETTRKYNNINLGFIVLNRASSIEEFYSFLYNKRSGLIKRILPENLDALILFSLDAVNTVVLDNLLEKNYIQTIVFNASNRVMAYLRSLGLDNIIQKEYDVRQSVYELGQKEYMLFRIYNRDGYVNIIDAECTEEEIKAYQNELRKNYKRYEKMDSYEEMFAGIVGDFEADISF